MKQNIAIVSTGDSEIDSVIKVILASIPFATFPNVAGIKIEQIAAVKPTKEYINGSFKIDVHDATDIYIIHTSYDRLNLVAIKGSDGKFGGYLTIPCITQQKCNYILAELRYVKECIENTFLHPSTIKRERLKTADKNTEQYIVLATELHETEVCEFLRYHIFNAENAELVKQAISYIKGYGNNGPYYHVLEFPTKFVIHRSSINEVEHTLPVAQIPKL